MATSRIARMAFEVAPPQFVNVMRNRATKMLDTIHEEDKETHFDHLIAAKMTRNNVACIASQSSSTSSASTASAFAASAFSSLSSSSKPFFSRQV